MEDMKNKKIVIFGVGQFFRNRKSQLYKLCYDKKIEIVGFIDNNSEEIKFFENKKVCSPDSICNMEYDIVLLMSVKFEEMKIQLLNFGVKENAIYRWNDFYDEMMSGKFQHFGGIIINHYVLKVLVLVHDFGYHGASMMTWYAAKALYSKGYGVTIAAQSGDIKFINEFIQNEKNIGITLCPGIFGVGQAEEEWITQYDVVFINVFPMLPAVLKISKFRPVLWWIHECDDQYSGIYTSTINKYSYLVSRECLNRVYIYAVSNIAQKAFNTFYSDRIQNILPLGIPDLKLIKSNIKKEKIIFSVVAGIDILKNQKFCLDVIEQMTEEERNKFEFWFIGKCDSSYARELTCRAENYSEIKLWGQLTRAEMEKVYEQIDVVVCPSLEETMSITIIEGMMYEKICITSDTTGIASYMKDGENGYIYKCNCQKELLEKMRIIIHQKDDLESIKRNARRTYEEIFSMEKFAERLEDALQDVLLKTNKNAGLLLGD